MSLAKVVNIGSQVKQDGPVMEGRKFLMVLVPNDTLFAHQRRIAKHFTSVQECMRARLSIRVILRESIVLLSEGVTLEKT